MKKAMSLMLLALLLAMMLSTVTAQEEEVEISVWKNGETFTIAPGQVAVLRAGWAACNKGLVHAWMNASYYEVWLNGDLLLTADQVYDLWGSVQPIPRIGGECIPKPNPHSAEWRYVLADLPAGEYELRSIITVTHPVPDGGDYDGDGQPDLFTPETYYMETVNTIVVVSN
jgi:hypothetical protein